MNSSDAASHVAAHLGISEGDIVIRSVQKTVYPGNPTVTEHRIEFEITKKGSREYSELRVAQVATNWRVAPQYVVRFADAYKNVSGVNKVVAQLSGMHYSKRIGAFHHADVAVEIGADDIRAFEEKFVTGIQPPQYIDIATHDNIAIEAKSLAVQRPVDKHRLQKDCHQAALRLVSATPAKVYDAAVVVYPLGTLTEVQAEIVALEAEFPGLKICEIDKLLDVLDDI